jgi:hypothetical protein
LLSPVWPGKASKRSITNQGAEHHRNLTMGYVAKRTHEAGNTGTRTVPGQASSFDLSTSWARIAQPKKEKKWLTIEFKRQSMLR